MADEFAALGVRIVGVAPDTEEQLRKMCEKVRIPFTQLSDPMLVTAQMMDIPISTQKSFYGAAAVHPVILKLPKKAFLQPAFFLWKGTELVYEWRQTETLRNLFGALGRPDGTQILEITREAMG